MAAVVADGTRYLLRSYHNSPVQEIGVDTPDAGDPGQQVRRFVDHLDVGEHVSMWWDGTVWQEGRLSAEVA